MYSYDWDKQTGGIILKTNRLTFSKEARPVYAQEMNILGFQQFWEYENQNEFPYLWAEANNYYYRGQLIARVSGGSIYSSPKLERQDLSDQIQAPLLPIDINLMIEKNLPIMDSLIHDSVQRLYQTYLQYSSKVDIFHVSYSGGKDSEVTLDLVQRALPHNSFVVIFGNTGMEFPDTYKAVYKAKERCESLGIKFYIASFTRSPEESWRIFGPPSQTIRWCCSVHKTAPQLLKLREILGKSDFREMSFVGVRADESAKRSEYDYISFGTKHNGQFSCNPILEWNSVEVFLYLFQNKLYINDAYKKGNSRAGCLVCPMSGEKADYMRYTNYPEEVSKFINIIKEVNTTHLETKEDEFRYYNIGGWKVRQNGRDIKTLPEKYTENETRTTIELSVTNPSTDWHEWIKTIGSIDRNNSGYILYGKEGTLSFSVSNNRKGYSVSINKPTDIILNTLVKKIKQVFRKAAYCALCHECEADCPHGYISMQNGVVHINDNCLKCCNCHKPDLGCLVYKSLHKPKGNIMVKSKSIDCYADHAPKQDWMTTFFSDPEGFPDNNSLGTNQFNIFKRFLRDAGCYSDKNQVTPLVSTLQKIGIIDSSFWAILLINLSYSPEINWYIKYVEPEVSYSRDTLKRMLEGCDVKPRGQSSITGAYMRILALPFGNLLGLGEVIENPSDKKNPTYIRHKWLQPDPRVILYSLYKFAEACGDYYQFTLARLLDHSIESDGVSPTQIFCLDKNDMEPMLKGLAITYPEFISASFTLDLDNIKLNSNKSSADVLELFKS